MRIDYNAPKSARDPTLGHNVLWTNTNYMKTCTKCEKSKPIIEYAKHVRYRDGHLTWCKACVSLNKKRWKLKNKDYLREDNRKYMKSPARRAWVNLYRKEKRNLRGIISDRLRSRIRVFILSRGIRKRKKTFELIGCTWSELKSHLESQFGSGMSWDNYGQWHIDHKIPMAAFGKNLKKSCHFSNLQPLWAKDNLRKHTKY